MTDAPLGLARSDGDQLQFGEDPCRSPVWHRAADERVQEDAVADWPVAWAPGGQHAALPPGLGAV
ncbi:hypothetical protein C4B68_39340 [Streptomyces dengpaensis]|uniref:MbtH family protein n=1 Tax=Streptomyces dengpaensis TaxID=2049881 RepID=A0ABN5IC99_9ACTN|nr:hypothetical protein C4B68_39340 [Streptomyces dengpaensis]PIB03971.1 hypothetical protein B1C81_34990 [Streptomyces sp. HG99]